MKKFLLILTWGIISQVFSQQTELGFNIGYAFDNLVDLEHDGNGKAIIGDKLSRMSYMAHATYYFADPMQVPYALAVGLKYHNFKRGSISAEFPESKIEISSHTVGIFGRYAVNLIPGKMIVYIDSGFGFLMLNDSDYYTGNHSQTESFSKLPEDLILKEHIITYMYAIGLEKEILRDKLKLFAELDGDAGISKINTSKGKFGTQPFGFGIGIKYLLKHTGQKEN